MSVVFSEIGAATFFENSVHNLFCRCCTLDDFTPGWGADGILKKLRKAKTNRAQVKIVETLFISRLNRKNIDDQLITTAVGQIKECYGMIKITQLAQKLNISQSQFEKRFRRIVGASPKKFALIIRMRHVMTLGRNYTSMTRLALDAGYFDQAHFTKVFKSFTGITPEKYFKVK